MAGKTRFFALTGGLAGAALLSVAALTSAVAAPAAVASPVDAASAAGPAATAEFAGARSIHPVCLIGVWNLLDIATYMQMLFGSGSHIQIQDVSGNIRLQFNDDDSMQERTDGITITALAGTDTLVETITGFVDANFVEEPSGTLTLSNMLGSFQVSAKLNDMLFLDNVDVSDALVGSGNPTFQYDCNGDRMSWQPQIPGRTVAPIIFSRGH